MKTEKTLAFIFIIGIIFKLLHWTGGNIIIVFSLFTIAIMYFPAAFYFFCDKDVKRQNITLSIISGFFLSVIPVGILFKIQYWQGSQIYLLTGIVATPIILILVYFLRSKATEDLKTYYKNMFARTIILTILTITFYLLPTATLLKIQYWDDQELARLKFLYYTYPGNEEYKKQHDEYLFKQDSIKLLNSYQEHNANK